MPAEPLDTVLVLRRRELDSARQKLAAAIDAAAEASTIARALERRIETETERASDPAGTDQLVEAFAAWLPGARHAVLQARAEQERKDGVVGGCRAELAACRAAMEAIETLIARRHAERQAALARAEQHELDEAGARRPTQRIP